MTIIDDFNRANENPLSSPYVTGDGGGAQLLTNAVRGTNGSQYNISIYEGSSFNSIHSSTVTVSTNAGGDYPIIGCNCSNRGAAGSTLDGYIAYVENDGGGGCEVFRYDNGVRTNIGGFACTLINGDEFQIRRISGTQIEILQNVTSLGTINDATYTDGSPALGVFFGNSNSTILDDLTMTGEVAVGPAIDTVDDPITPGSNAHTVSGFGATVNAGTFTTGTAELAFTTANDTTSTIAEPVNGGDAVEYGVSGTYELTDGTDIATINTTMQPSAGNAIVTLTTGFDTSDTSWLYLYGGTPAIGDQAYYPSADLTLNPDGTLSGEAGTYACYFIDLSDAQPLYEAFDVILGESGGPLLTLPTGTATGQTTASGTVTTDTGDGTLYYLFSENASELAATIKAANNQAISATGLQNVTYTGLTAGTTYYPHYIQTDAALDDSNVSTGSSFVTDAVTAPELAPTKALGGTVDVAFARTLTQTGGSAATSWSIVGGADQAEYTLSNAGLLERNTPNTVEESEVVDVTATNSAGTSGTQVVTITYTISSNVKTIDSVQISSSTIQSFTI